MPRRNKKRKKRRHTNNKGWSQIRRGNAREFIKRLAKKLNIPYNKGDYKKEEE